MHMWCDACVCVDGFSVSLTVSLSSFINAACGRTGSKHVWQQRECAATDSLCCLMSAVGGFYSVELVCNTENVSIKLASLRSSGLLIMPVACRDVTVSPPGLTHRDYASGRQPSSVRHQVPSGHNPSPTTLGNH